MKRLFTNTHIIDVLEGAILKNHSILTEDGYITAVGPNLQDPEAETIDLKGHYLSPGLFNLHIHVMVNELEEPSSQVNHSTVQFTLTALENLEKLLKSGVTYVRDVGSADNVAIELMHAIENGRVKMAPDMEAAGRPICMTGGTTWYFIGHEADGPDECRKAARLMLRSGANVIKLMATGGVVTKNSNPGAVQLGEDELRAAIEEAHKMGYPAVCHAESLEGVKNALKAGIDVIEHGDVLDDETIQMMLEQGVFLDGTVSACYSIMRISQDEEYIRKCKLCMQTCFDSFRKAYQAGVICTLGSDCGTPGCHFDESGFELVVMVEDCGVSPFDALKIGTINSAMACRKDHILGSVTVGKKAHFAVFEKNPTEDIHAIMDCAMTIKNGEILWNKTV